MAFCNFLRIRNKFFFKYLQRQGKYIEQKNTIKRILTSDEFSTLYSINVMPLIYDKVRKKCNIMVFNFQKAYDETDRILFVDKDEAFDAQSGNIVSAKGRKHPIYLFVDSEGRYICEVRYGGASANALQRGVWTHTKKALTYFDSLTNGWIGYSLNEISVKLFSIALNASREGHEKANEVLLRDIEKLKEKNGRRSI